MNQKLTVKKVLLAGAILFSSACQMHSEVPVSSFPGLLADNGQILPGSKGDRKQFQQLEARVQIPLVRFEFQGFAVQSQLDIADQLKRMKVLLNGQPVDMLYQSHRVTETDVEAVFVLKEAVFEPYLFHEIVFSTADDLPQVATLWEHNSLDETLYLSLNAVSTARWAVAVAYQREQGKPVQSLSAASYRDLVALPEVAVLAQKARTLPLQDLLGDQIDIAAGVRKLKARQSERDKLAAENAGSQGNANGNGPSENNGQGSANGNGPSENNGQGSANGNGPSENNGQGNANG
ncbi:MAG: hypothetical protein IGS03_13260, partial [Candidatus Sericytochromatia bacterium]|nr:hypothetical protein [Candidatus Sericytochromatia bacterium]